MSTELAMTNDAPAQAIQQGSINSGSIDLAQLEAEMKLADMVAHSSMVPKAYQGQPGNVIIAWGLGAAMGLGRMESLYRIDVIQGTPAASAELIAANTRKAGHRLVVKVDKENVAVTATITRFDQPDEPYEVCRDMAWAKQMGLSGKDNYQKQPLTMLQWRAISACARLACSEALYGVGYTPDELRDNIVQGKIAEASARRVRSSAAALTGPVPTGEVTTVMDSRGKVGQIAKAKVDPDAMPASEDQLTEMGAALSAAGITTAAKQGEFILDTIGHRTTRENPPTAAEAEQITDAANAILNGDGQ